MRLHGTLILFALLAPGGEAAIVNLGASTQKLTLTGTGPDSSKAGTARVTLGACSYDGANTTCILSGSYTAVGGGAYQFKLVYAGNGPSPLTAVISPPGGSLYTMSLAAGTLSFTLTPSGGSAQFYDFTGNFFYDSTAACTGVSSCSVSTVGQSQGGTITGPVTGSFDPTPRIGSVITAGAYGGFDAIAPASWVEIYGTNLATVTGQTWAASDFNGANAPQVLGGTMVSVATRLGYISYASLHQVNVLVPSGVAAGQQTVVVTNTAGSGPAATVTTNSVQPGLLAPAAFEAQAGQYAAALFPDGTTYVLPPGVTSAVPTARAKPGDTIVLYGIGFGPVTPNIDAGVVVQQANTLSGVRVFIGGAEAKVLYAGLVQGFLGLYQFNVQVPSVPPDDSAPLTFSLNGTAGTQKLILPVGR